MHPQPCQKTCQASEGLGRTWTAAVTSLAAAMAAAAADAAAACPPDTAPPTDSVSPPTTPPVASLKRCTWGGPQLWLWLCPKRATREQDAERGDPSLGLCSTEQGSAGTLATGGRGPVASRLCCPDTGKSPQPFASLHTQLSSLAPALKGATERERKHGHCKKPSQWRPCAQGPGGGGGTRPLPASVRPPAALVSPSSAPEALADTLPARPAAASSAARAASDAASDAPLSTTSGLSGKTSTPLADGAGSGGGGGGGGGGAAGAGGGAGSTSSTAPRAAAAAGRGRAAGGAVQQRRRAVRRAWCRGGRGRHAEGRAGARRRRCRRRAVQQRRVLDGTVERGRGRRWKLLRRVRGGHRELRRVKRALARRRLLERVVEQRAEVHAGTGCVRGCPAHGDCGPVGTCGSLTRLHQAQCRAAGVLRQDVPTSMPRLQSAQHDQLKAGLTAIPEPCWHRWLRLRMLCACGPRHVCMREARIHAMCGRL